MTDAIELPDVHDGYAGGLIVGVAGDSVHIRVKRDGASIPPSVLIHRTAFETALRALGIFTGVEE